MRFNHREQFFFLNLDIKKAFDTCYAFLLASNYNTVKIQKVEISKCSHLFLEMVSVNRLYFLARDDPDIETDHSSMRFTGSV